MDKAEIALEIFKQCVHVPVAEDVTGSGWQDARPLKQAARAAAAYNAIYEALKLETSEK